MWIRSKLIFIVWLCFQISLGTSITAQDSKGSRGDAGCTTGKSYIVINASARSFFGAWRFCMALGMKLATITSAADSVLIEEAVKRSSNPKGPWWISGTDLGMEGSFVWISTNDLVGRPSGYFNYSPGQPDNAGGDEHCLEIGRWGGVVWNDAPCHWLQRFICELQT